VKGKHYRCAFTDEGLITGNNSDLVEVLTENVINYTGLEFHFERQVETVYIVAREQQQLLFKQ
jgi:hypothetical protein